MVRSARWPVAAVLKARRAYWLIDIRCCSGQARGRTREAEGWGTPPAPFWHSQRMPYGSNDGYGRQQLRDRPSTTLTDVGRRHMSGSSMSSLLSQGDVEIRKPVDSCALPSDVKMLRVCFRDVAEARRRAAVLFMLTWDPRKKSFIPFFTFDMMVKVLSLQLGAPADEYDGADPCSAIVRSVPGLASLPSARIRETFGKLRGKNAAAGNDEGESIGREASEGQQAVERGGIGTEAHLESLSIVRSAGSTPAPRPGTAVSAGATAMAMTSTVDDRVAASRQSKDGATANGIRRENLRVEQLLESVPLYQYPEHLSVHVPPSIESNISEAFKSGQRHKGEQQEKMIARREAFENNAIKQLAARMAEEVDREGRGGEAATEEIVEGQSPRFQAVDVQEVRKCWCWRSLSPFLQCKKQKKEIPILNASKTDPTKARNIWSGAEAQT